MIYLDNAATTYPKPEEVYVALDKANREYAFNAGRGSYKKAKEVNEIIEDTRSYIAKMVGGNYENVVFTSSATESLNKIIFGLEWSNGDNVYVSPFEHNSIIRPLEEIKKKYNINLNLIPFDKETWEPSEDMVNIFATKKPKYIFCSAKSNVTGLNLNYKMIFEEGKKYNSINIVDASQSFGVDKKINLNNTDFIVFAGHKSLYASFGIAGFVKSDKVNLNKTLFGGTGSDTLNPEMPKTGVDRFEAGSHNAVAIYGLNESLKWLDNNDVESKEKKLTEYAITKMRDNKKINLYLPNKLDSVSGIVSFNVEGYSADDIGKILDEEFDICVRTGYHCAPFIHDFIGSKQSNGTVRMSLNYFNNESDIDELIKALKTF